MGLGADRQEDSVLQRPAAVMEEWAPDVWLAYWVLGEGGLSQLVKVGQTVLCV